MHNLGPFQESTACYDEGNAITRPARRQSLKTRSPKTIRAPSQNLKPVPEEKPSGNAHSPTGVEKKVYDQRFAFEIRLLP